jgi:hypothetical protein
LYFKRESKIIGHALIFFFLPLPSEYKLIPNEGFNFSTTSKNKNKGLIINCFFNKKKLKYKKNSTLTLLKHQRLIKLDTHLHLKIPST